MIVDLFAGPGGWDVAAHRLGMRPLGIEWDEAACATRKAAGLRTMRADVASVEPREFGKLDGLIASPPCQAWSMAGKRGGECDKELCVQAAMELAAGNDTRHDLREQCEDERSILVVEPLRWALACEPGWIAMEQVPPVIEMWSLFAQILSTKGYHVWAGVLEAERYGVPQTRERAILMARRDGAVHPPRPTHQRYVKGEPQRHDVTFDGEVLPWVSMAQALGWDEGGAAYRLARGEGMSERHGDRRAVPDDEPAPVITSKARTASWEPPTHYDQRQAGAVPRPTSEPAPTMLSEGLRKGVPIWKYRASTMPNAAVRDVSEPAPTVLFGHASNDSRGLPEPKYRKGNERQWNENAVRVTIEQASILQSFPPDYPWQGSRTKQFEQIGNAVPPLLAEHILSALTGAQRVEVRDAA